MLSKNKTESSPAVVSSSQFWKRVLGVRTVLHLGITGDSRGFPGDRCPFLAHISSTLAYLGLLNGGLCSSVAVAVYDVWGPSL